MTTKFPRAHQFNKLDPRQQHEFAKDMTKVWGGIVKDLEETETKLIEGVKKYGVELKGVDNE